MKLALLDITTMNDLEMQGILLNLIAKAKRNQLIQLFEIFKSDKDGYIETDIDIENLPYALTVTSRWGNGIDRWQRCNSYQMREQTSSVIC